jgi:hypothetical protein
MSKKKKKKSKKFVTSEKEGLIIFKNNRSQNLTYREYIDLADEIKKVLLNKANNIDEMRDNPQVIVDRLKVIDLGYRLSKAFLHEYKLSIFFSLELYTALYKKLKAYNNGASLRMNEDDLQLLEDNKHEGIEHISKIFYVNRDGARKLLNKVK